MNRDVYLGRQHFALTARLLPVSSRPRPTNDVLAGERSGLDFFPSPKSRLVVKTSFFPFSIVVG